MLPQSAAVAFVLAKVAVNGAVVECDLVVFAQIDAYLFGTEFAADKGVDVLNQLRIELIGFSLTLFDSPALPLGFSALYCCPWVRCRLISRLMVLLWRLSCLAISAMVPVAGQVLDRVSFVLGQLRVAHGNLSCRKGRCYCIPAFFCYGKLHFKCESARD